MTQSEITLDPETQRRARRRATGLGMSLAEYVRRLILRDLNGAQAGVFDLGRSTGSDIQGTRMP